MHYVHEIHGVSRLFAINKKYFKTNYMHFVHFIDIVYAKKC